MIKIATLALLVAAITTADAARGVTLGSANFVEVINRCVTGDGLQASQSTAVREVCELQCQVAKFCVGYTWQATDGACKFILPMIGKSYSLAATGNCSTFVRSDVSYSASPFYGGYKLTNPGVVVAGVGISAADCYKTASAVAGASAISYRASIGECAYSLCGNLETARDDDSVVVILSSPLLEVAEVPAATQEWMLTDQCGFGSTGTVDDAALTMRPGAITFNAAPSALFGKAVELAGTANSYLDAVTTSSGLQFGTQFCASFFYYANKNANGPFMEFYKNGAMDLHIWRWSDAVTSFLNFHIGEAGVGNWVSASGAYYVGLPMAITTWKHEAFCVDTALGRTLFFEEGKLAKTQAWNYRSSFMQWNQLNLGKRVGDDTNVWPGRLFCVKMFDRILSEADMLKVRQSCLVGRLRVGRD